MEQQLRLGWRDGGGPLVQPADYSVDALPRKRDGSVDVDAVLDMQEAAADAERLQLMTRQKEVQHRIFLSHIQASKERAAAAGSDVVARPGPPLEGEEQLDTVTRPSSVLAGSSLSASSSSKSPINSLFSEGISIMVDGRTWKNVLLSDSPRGGQGEAILLVFGLQPGHPAKIEICVGPHAVSYAVGRARRVQERARRRSELESMLAEASGQGPVAREGERRDEYSITFWSAVLILSFTADARSLSKYASPARSRSNSPAASVALHSDLAPAAVKEAPVSAAHIARMAQLRGELSAAAETKSALSAEVRKARKEASRAESALRNEIEAVKRGLDRMSGTDHRSKQKVLALQESIRQANMQAEEAEEETKGVEAGLPEWKRKEDERTGELEETQKVADEKDSALQAVLKENADVLGSQQKELDQLIKKLTDITGQSDKLEAESIKPMLDEIKSLEEEIANVDNAPVDVYPDAVQHELRGARSAQFHPHSAGFTGRGGTHLGFTGRGGKGAGRYNRGGRGGKHVHNLSIGSDAMFDAGYQGPRSASQPLSGKFSAASSTSSFPLNPNKPEFVPSSVLLAQAQQQQQHQQQPYGQHQPQQSFSQREPEPAHPSPFSSIGTVPSPLNTFHSGPLPSASSFQPFSPIQPSPPASDNMHRPMDAPHSSSIASAMWPTGNADLASILPPLPNAGPARAPGVIGSNGNSPWASPMLAARRGSGLASHPSAPTIPSSGIASSTIGAEKDIWSNPASSRSGNNIWGPLSGFGSSALTNRPQEGSVGSGGSGAGTHPGRGLNGGGTAPGSSAGHHESLSSFSSIPGLATIPSPFSSAAPLASTFGPVGSGTASAPHSPVAFGVGRITGTAGPAALWDRSLREQRGSDSSSSGSHAGAGAGSPMRQGPPGAGAGAGGPQPAAISTAAGGTPDNLAAAAAAGARSPISPHATAAPSPLGMRHSEDAERGPA